MRAQFGSSAKPYAARVGRQGLAAMERIYLPSLQVPEQEVDRSGENEEFSGALAHDQPFWGLLGDHLGSMIEGL